MSACAAVPNSSRSVGPIACTEAVAWFYEIASPDIELHRFLRARGVDMATALQLAGPVCECPIIRFPMTREFQFGKHDESGTVLAVVHVVSAADAKTPLGLVAWCRDRPDDVYHSPGMAALGIDQLDNPASFFGGKALQVHRTPLGWLAAGCQGIVPLDPESLWIVMGALPERRGGYDLDDRFRETDHIGC
jgi:hypothetical protein